MSLDRNEEAVEWLRRAVQGSPPPYTLYRDILAAALARSGQRAQAEEELRHALETLPCLTVSMVRHWDVSASSRLFRNAIADGLALAGLRDNAGVGGRVSAAPGRCGQTMTQPPGVTRVTTDELRRMTTRDRAPILLQTFHADVAIPGTVWVSPETASANAPNATVEAFRHQLETLTGGDFDRPIVTIAWNIETADPRLLAGLTASLGYRWVFSDPEGLEAWIAHNLPLDVAENRGVTPVVDNNQATAQH